MFDAFLFVFILYSQMTQEDYYAGWKVIISRTAFPNYVEVLPRLQGIWTSLSSLMLVEPPCQICFHICIVY